MRNKKRDWAARFACCYLLLCAAVICCPEFFSQVDPLATDTGKIFLAPSMEHFFGTDQTGRDVFSRVIYGARTTVLSGFFAAVIAAAGGAVLGAGFALLPKAVGNFFERILDAVMAIPEFLIALLIMAYTGSGVYGVVAAVALATFPGYARIALHSSWVLLMGDAFITAKILGVSWWRRLFVYLLPQVAKSLLGVTILGIGLAVLMIAGLTFLGLGLTPPAPDWGAMLSQGKLFINRGWWSVLFPGLALVCTVAAFAFAGNWLKSRFANA